MTKELLNNFLMEVQYLANKDFDASSEDTFTHCPGGKARAACNFMSEAGLINSASAQVIKDPSTKVDLQGQFHMLGEIGTMAQSREIFNKGCADLSEAIMATPDSELGADVTAPWGLPTTKGMLMLHSISHCMYHLGQLNQIQLIKGDEEVHWM